MGPHVGRRTATFSRRALARTAALAMPAALAFLPPRAAHAQVDQQWLRTWMEAQTHRPAELSSRSRIAPEGEPGTPLVIHGRVLTPDGSTPVPDVVVFAYQTDREGEYHDRDKPGRPWRLQGWARSDQEGRFRFETIRPGSYPSGGVPAHVHLSVDTAVYGRQWTPELRFADDPLVDARAKARSAGDPFGQVRELRMEGAVAHVDFHIRLKPRGDF